MAHPLPGWTWLQLKSRTGWAGAARGFRGLSPGLALLDLDAFGDPHPDPGARLVDRRAVLLLPAAVPERDRTGGDVVVPGQQHVGHLLALRVADLLLHPVRAVVDPDPDPLLAQPRRDTLQV